MTSKSRRGRPKKLKRKSETVPVRTTFRLYTEGKSTEPDYIDALKRSPGFLENVFIDIQIQQVGMQPMTLVERARADKRSDSLDVDFYWCVFDVESPLMNPHLDRARQMAADNQIHLAISNPCFELWLILHFQDQSAYLSTDEAVQLRGRLDGTSGKGLDGGLYVPLRGQAMSRADRLRAKHIADGTRFPHDNPSSSFDRFLLQVESELEPRQSLPAAQQDADGSGG